MKKIYLTFDIETIVSGISRNENYIAAVYLGAMFMANELKKRSLKATFFVSLSSKQASIDQGEYLSHIQWLIQSLKAFDNIRVEPHIHAYRLPVGFECSSDRFEQYNLSQQVELLRFAKDFFYKEGIDVSAFRPGGFSKNDAYYTALSQAGYKYSSILHKDENVDIDLLTGKTFSRNSYEMSCGIVEYPVTSVKIKSIKGKTEVLNLSPDFFTLTSVEKYLKELEYININFHSFSVYINRLVRENHEGLLKNNVKFLLLENLLNRILSFTRLQAFNTDTLVCRELINWLDFIQVNVAETYFIGE